MDVTPAGLLRAYLAAGDGRRYDDLDRCLAPDVVVHSPGGATFEGVAAQVETWDAAHAGLDGLRHAVVEVVAQQDRVAARVRVTGRHTGTFLGVAATGAAIEVDQALFARVVDGRLAELWEVVDTGAGLRQLGVLGDQPLGPGQ